MADMKLDILTGYETGWMKYVEMLEIAESRGVPAQFDAELCGLIAKAIRHKNSTIEAQEAEIKRLREALGLIAMYNHEVIFEEPVDWQDVSNTFVGIAQATLNKGE